MAGTSRNNATSARIPKARKPRLPTTRSSSTGNEPQSAGVLVRGRRVMNSLVRSSSEWLQRLSPFLDEVRLSAKSCSVAHRRRLVNVQIRIVNVTAQSVSWTDCSSKSRCQSASLSTATQSHRIAATKACSLHLTSRIAVETCATAY